MYSFAIDKHNPRERDASLISRVDIVVACAGLSEPWGPGGTCGRLVNQKAKQSQIPAIL